LLDLQKRFGFNVQGLMRQLQNARVVGRKDFGGGGLF
jgi:hypothetical protein